MYDEPAIETARQRAERMWRNSWIKRHPPTDDEPQIIDIQNTERRDNQIRTKLANEIKQVLTESKKTQTIEYYRIFIKSRMYKLLKEKLRRLESKNNG